MSTLISACRAAVAFGSGRFSAVPIAQSERTEVLLAWLVVLNVVTPPPTDADHAEAAPGRWRWR